MNSSKYFGKNVTFDNLKSCKKAGLYPLSIKYIFEKAIRG